MCRVRRWVCVLSGRYRSAACAPPLRLVVAPPAAMKRSLTIQPSLEQFFKKQAAKPKSIPVPSLSSSPPPPSPKALIRSLSTRNPAPERALENQQKKPKLEQVIADLSEPPEVSAAVLSDHRSRSKKTVSFSPSSPPASASSSTAASTAAPTSSASPGNKFIRVSSTPSFHQSAARQLASVRDSQLKRTHVHPKAGIRIQVRHGDITGEPVDCIVNAANSGLAHGAGVAGAISLKGGPEIQRESDEYVRKNGTVPTGEVAVTGAGRLLCKHVIHAVGPIYHEDKRGSSAVCDQELVSAVWNSLMTAHEMNLQSISLPAISSGIFGFPKRRCAQFLFDTALRFCTKFPSSTVREIRFTNYDRETVNIFEEEFDSRFLSQTTNSLDNS